MVTETFSIGPKDTETCKCCGGDSAVRASRSPEIVAEYFAVKKDMEMDCELIECHACGYSWYNIELFPTESPPAINIVHDASTFMPGQPFSGLHPLRGTPLLITAKPAGNAPAGMPGETRGDGARHFVYPPDPTQNRSLISEEVFQDELEQRMRARRSVACN